MKKVVLFAVSVLVVIAFASAGMAEVGHVGHVDEDVTVVTDFEEVSSDDVGITGGTITSFDQEDPSDEDVDSFVGSIQDGTFVFVDLPEDTTYNVTITNAVKLDISHTGAAIVLDFSAVPGTWTGVMIREKAPNEARCHYFAKDADGKITIDDPDLFFTENEVVFIELEEASSTTTTSGGGGGGCNAGAFSPLMGLLALPLMFMLKK